MFKKCVLVLVVLIGTFSLANAQDTGMASLRVMQLSFATQEDDASAAIYVEISVDGMVVVDRIGFPFTTDYFPVEAGEHTITTSIDEDPNVSASFDLELAANGRYTVIVTGNYSAGEVAYTVVDEAGLPLEATGSAGIFVNLTGESADVYVDDTLAVENLSTDDYALVSLPAEDFVIRATKPGDTETVLLEDEIIGLPNTTLLGVAYAESSGTSYTIFHRSSDLTLADYLRGAAGTGYFGSGAALIEGAGILSDLGDDGEYTVFLPNSEVIDALPEGALPADNAQLADLLSNHIVAENLPPYEMGMENLTTLGGNTVTIRYTQTDSGYWEIEGAPILWDVRLANGIVYAIEGVVLP